MTSIIILKFISKQWKLILIVGLLIACFAQCGAINTLRTEADKWENNYNVEKEGAQKTIGQKNMEISDYLKTNKEVDSLLKAERIKKNRVEYIQVIRYRDTGSVRVELDTIMVYLDGQYVKMISGEYKTTCYWAKWSLIEGDTAFTHDYRIDTDLSIIGHAKRENEFKMFNRKLFNYGKKRSYVTIINKCDSSEILTNEYVRFGKK